MVTHYSLLTASGICMLLFQILSRQFISKSSVLAVAVASTQGPELYATVSSVCISCGYNLYYLLYHAGELLKCFYKVHVIRIIEVHLLFITSQFKPWVC